MDNQTNYFTFRDFKAIVEACRKEYKMRKKLLEADFIQEYIMDEVLNPVYFQMAYIFFPFDDYGDTWEQLMEGDVIEVDNPVYGEDIPGAPDTPTIKIEGLKDIWYYVNDQQIIRV